MKKQNKKSVKPKYSLSDLTNGLIYLEKTANQIDAYIRGIEPTIHKLREEIPFQYREEIKDFIKPITEKKDIDENILELIKNYNSAVKEYETMTLRFQSVTHKALKFKNEISQILLSPDEQEADKTASKFSKQHRVTDSELIQEYLNLTMQLSRILKGNDFKALSIPQSSFYRKMGNKIFLIKLVAEVQAKLDSGYKYRAKTRKLLETILENTKSNLVKLSKKESEIEETESESNEIFTDEINRYSDSSDKENWNESEDDFYDKLDND